MAVHSSSDNFIAESIESIDTKHESTQTGSAGRRGSRAGLRSRTKRAHGSRLEGFSVIC
jgi:hypothetical protein